MTGGSTPDEHASGAGRGPAFADVDRALRGRRVLVTGATGFIGGRLVERSILAHGAAVRALVSSFTRCARLARFPVELVRGDLLDRRSVHEAARDCEVVFHCAYGSRGDAARRRRVNVEGTENVLSAARATGARVVHVSSQAVYGTRGPGDLDEDAPLRPSGSSYAESKLEAEERALAAAREGLPVSVLQPTAVYGPFAPVWTVGVLERMRERPLVLVDDGEGPCNAVYVDDVVGALLLAACRDGALGERLLISAAEPTTWRAFYGHFERMLAREATVSMTAAQARKLLATTSRRRSAWRELADAIRQDAGLRARLRRSREGAWWARAERALPPLERLRRRAPPKATSGAEPSELARLRRLRGGPPPAAPHVPSAAEIALQTQGARVRIDRARRVLGYLPAFDLEAGMRLTDRWARWAGLAPDPDPEPHLPE